MWIGEICKQKTQVPPARGRETCIQRMHAEAVAGGRRYVEVVEIRAP